MPRLLEARVAVQGFGIVTKVPGGLNIERNEAGSDPTRLLALVQQWPFATLWSTRARALYQAQRFRAATERSSGRLTLIRSRRDLAVYLARRRADPHVAAGFLALEGAHALEGDLASIEVLFDAGIRMMSPTHFVDTDIAGSAHGVEKSRLTALGRRWLQVLEQKRILIDLSHASAAAFDDVVRAASRPVVVSHTGVRATCDNARNLSDDQLLAVAKTGGLVGIGYWPIAVCGEDAGAVARAIRHAIGVIGPEHVALGSDFDGACRVPFDVTGLPLLVDALLDEGLDEPVIRAVMGGSLLRFLAETLPE